MFQKLCAMRANAKKNKGFSLVELIIVIAIMVALVAVMAPQFVKYVQKSRNSALQTAAEDFLATVKTEFADGNVKLAGTTTTYIKVSVNASGNLEIKEYSDEDGKTEVTSSQLANAKDTSTTAKVGLTLLTEAAGLDSAKAMGSSEYYYVIKIATGPAITMAQKTVTTT